jgi:hypothetical protein
MDFLAEGYEPSGFRTVRIANEGNVETGALEASADDPCLEFDGGVSTLAIDSIPAGGSAQFGFRIKAGLAAGLYQATVTVSGISLQEKSFPVVFEVGAPGGLNSIQAIENYLASETGSLAQPLGITTSLNLMEWPRLLELLDAAGDYVSLDLSDCPISALTESTAFDPDPSISAGKDRIVSLILPEAVNSIVAGTAGNPAFGGFASLERLGARNVTGAGAYCFTDLAALKTLDLPALASIGSYAFSGCAVLNTLDLPTLASVGDYAFSGCVALESVNLPALASIGNGAFSGCKSLETVELPALVNMTGALVKANNNRITYLPLEPPFLNCVGLRSVSLPALRLVYSEAFTGCASLESISLGSEPPSLWNLEVIDGSLGIRQRKWLSGCATAPRTITVYVPAAALGAYLSAWDGAISTSGMLNSVTAIQTWNYVWDNDLATRENLTVQLAEIKGGTNE